MLVQLPVIYLQATILEELWDRVKFKVKPEILCQVIVVWAETEIDVFLSWRGFGWLLSVGGNYEVLISVDAKRLDCPILEMVSLQCNSVRYEV